MSAEEVLANYSFSSLTKSKLLDNLDIGIGSRLPLGTIWFGDTHIVHVQTFQQTYCKIYSDCFQYSLRYTDVIEDLSVSLLSPLEILTQRNLI